MSEVILFGDPRLVTRDLLHERLAASTDPSALGVTVSTKPRNPDDAAKRYPYVQVRSSGAFRDARLNGRATVRVLVWHRDEGLGLRLAALCEALLLSASSPATRGYTPVSGPLPTEDDDTGEPLTFFSLTVRLPPEQL